MCVWVGYNRLHLDRGRLLLRRDPGPGAAAKRLAAALAHAEPALRLRLRLLLLLLLRTAAAAPAAAAAAHLLLRGRARPALTEAAAARAARGCSAPLVHPLQMPLLRRLRLGRLVLRRALRILQPLLPLARRRRAAARRRRARRERPALLWRAVLDLDRLGAVGVLERVQRLVELVGRCGGQRRGWGA